MRIACESCGAQYRIDDARVPPSGVKLKCPKCLTVFSVKPGSGVAQAASQPVRAQPSEVALPAAAPPSSTLPVAAPSHGPLGVRFMIRRDGMIVGAYTEAEIAVKAGTGELDGREEISREGQAWIGVRTLPSVDQILRVRGTPPPRPVTPPSGRKFELPAEPLSGPNLAAASAPPARAPAGPAALDFDMPDLPGPPPRRDHDDDLRLPTPPVGRPTFGGGLALSDSALPAAPAAPARAPSPLWDPSDAAAPPGDALALSPPPGHDGRLDFDLAAPPADAPRMPPPGSVADLPAFKAVAPGRGPSHFTPPPAAAPMSREQPTMRLTPPPPAGGAAGAHDFLPPPLPAPFPAPSSAAPKPRGMDLELDLSEADLPSSTPPPQPAPVPDEPQPLFSVPRAQGQGKTPPPVTAPRAGTPPPLSVSEPAGDYGAQSLDLGEGYGGDGGFGPPPDAPAERPPDPDNLELDGATQGPPGGTGTRWQPVSLDSVDMDAQGAAEDGAMDAAEPYVAPSRAPAVAPWMLAVFGAVLLVGGGLAVGKFTDFGPFFLYAITGNRPGKSEAEELVRNAQRDLARDTAASYSRAADRCTQALAKLPKLLEAKAVRAQATFALAYRYGAGQLERDLAQNDLSGLAEAKGPVLRERDKARGLEALAGDRAPEAAEILRTTVAGDGARDGLAFTFYGWALLRARNVTDAVDKLTQAVVLAPESDGASYALGLARRQQGKDPEASAEFEKVLARNPDHIASAVELGDMAWRAGEKDKARERLSQVVKAASPREAGRAEAILGLIALEDGKTDEAQARFTHAIESDRKNVDALVGLGRILFGAGKPSEALTRYKTARDLDPGALDAALGLVRCYTQLGQFMDARREAEALLRANPKQVEARVLLGQVQERLEQPDSAIEMFTQAIADDPKYLDAYLGLARVYLARKDGDRKKAIEDALAALKQGETALGSIAELRNAVGEVYLAQDDLPRARDEFHAALEKKPTLHQARFNLARALERDGKQAEAVSEYESIKAQDKNFPGLAERLGRIFVAQGRKDRAVSEFEIALGAEAPSVELRLAAGDAYIRVGQFDKAKAQADKLLEQQPDSTAARVLRGRALTGLKSPAEAIQQIKEALRAVPNEPAFHAALAGAYEAASQDEEALSAYQESLRLDPTQLDVRLALAHLLFDLKQFSEALKHLELALKQDPNDARTYALMGACYREMGGASTDLAHGLHMVQGGKKVDAREQAVKAYQDATRLDPADGGSYYAVGEILNETGKWAASVAALEKYREHLPDDANKKRASDANFYLGQGYRALGQTNKAVEAYKRVIELSTDDSVKDEARRELRFLTEAK